jgi:hypothetical protein
VFLFAAIPYVLNIVNFLGYPRELDGAAEARRRPNALGVLGDSLRTVVAMWRSRSLRGLTVESMGWEGVSHAVKDYLQPALTVVAIRWLSAAETPATASEVAATETDPANVMLISLVYTALFLLSGLASRNAHRLVARAGDENRAARRMWWYNLAAWLWLGVSDLLGFPAVVALAFVFLAVLENVWRPILVSRYDQHADPEFGATVLSIESQAQKLATLVVAPLAGLAVDAVARSGGTGQFWPVAAIGLAASALVLAVVPGAPRDLAAKE